MENTSTTHINLTQYSWVRRVLRSRWPQFILRAITLAGFALVILTGFLGSPVGSSNFAIMLVWIGWWSALKLVMLPFGGRAWCSICPIPMPGEWLQQGWLIKPGGKGINLGLRWPRKLRNTWLQSAGFALIGVFSALVLTTPVATAWIFLGLIIISILVSVVFEQRSFCRYVCPMGGFIGCYSRLAPLELRPGVGTNKSMDVKKEWPRGCPWINNPAALNANANCGLCLECLRTPSGDSMVVNLRPFNAELTQPGAFRLDESFLSLGLLGSVMVYSAVFLGPWGELKQTVMAIGSADWWVFAVLFVLGSFGVLPAVVAAVTALTRNLAKFTQPLRWLFTRYTRALLPLGLMFWIAFTITFAFSKMSYLWPVLSDPFGWGWDLFGTASAVWQPYLVSLTPSLNVLLLLVGFIWTGKAVFTTSNQIGLPAGQRGALIPLILFIAAVTTTMLWLLIG